MEEFYIDVELNRGITRIQVEEIPPEQWDMPYTPQFVIDYHTSKGFITFTIRLEEGRWYDRNTRISEDEFYLRYLELGDGTYNPNYPSPLSEFEIQEVGNAIARYMIIQLTAYMGLFIPSFRTPTLN